MNLIKYNRGVQHASHDEEVSKKWFTSRSSLIGAGEEEKWHERTGKSNHDESTRDRSRSIFTKELERDVGRYVQVQVDKESFMHESARILDLKKVKQLNKSFLSDERSVRLQIEEGKLQQAETERAERAREAKRQRETARHIFA